MAQRTRLCHPLVVQVMASVVMVLLTVVGQAATQKTQEIGGRVADAAGGSLPGVTVTITRLGGEAVVLTTAADGTYRANLPNGIYRLEFSRPGFDPLTHAGIVLLPGERVALNVRLRVSDPSTVVEVKEGQTPVGALMAGEELVRLETPQGAIVLAIDTRRAPNTAANFLRYVDGGFYDGGQFHRVTRPDNYTPAPPERPMMEMIQGGINPSRRGDSFPPIALERTSVTGLKHVAGTVAMARAAGADTARSDFFILLDDQPSLDFGGGRFEDKQGSAAFGRVVSGLDVVRKIQQQPVKGDRLTPPVTISRAYRVKPAGKLEPLR